MRLIDADALLAEYDRQHEGEPGKARKLIEDAPTINRPTRSQFKRMAAQLGYDPVVHCRECKHHVTGYCFRDINGRTNMFRMFDNDFCSYGERKNNGNENCP